MKKYKLGFYGGKFMPMHLGHQYCIETAAMECEKLYVIMFINGADERRILETNHDPMLTIENRILQLNKVCKKLGGLAHVVSCVIDVQNCVLPNGDEDWDAETPLVRDVLGDHIDAVYSSEISYSQYFAEAYPEAEHRIVDYPREHYPISATKIRNMKKESEIAQWKI